MSLQRTPRLIGQSTRDPRAREIESRVSQPGGLGRQNYPGVENVDGRTKTVLPANWVVKGKLCPKYRRVAASVTWSARRGSQVGRVSAFSPLNRSRRTIKAPHNVLTVVQLVVSISIVPRHLPGTVSQAAGPSQRRTDDDAVRLKIRSRRMRKFVENHDLHISSIDTASQE